MSPSPSSTLSPVPELPDLPIREVLDELRQVLRRGRNVVLQAPPGAGKTTVVPLALLGEPWRGDDRIVMLEPRRLAARAAAHRMAHLLGQRVGETVGYRMRRDTVVGPTTRIEVVTEGVLTRMLNTDPTLDGVALVIFDEFHERSVHADLGLALTLHSQRLVRDSLRLLVMSATLAGAPIAQLLGDAPVITSEGRLFPVAVRWLPRRADQPVEPSVASAVRRALGETEGDLLVFLPGEGEIGRTAALLRGTLDESVGVHPLFGNLPFAEQDRAIAPAPVGRRKVVLATAIAESSLTIEGVRVVVDAGLARVPRWAAGPGMTRLETIRVSRASAEQRAGRAGRLGPGSCYRLWAMEEHAGLVPHATPEILETDLAPLVLELAAAGITDPTELPWLDPPPAAGVAQARELLRQLDALGDDVRITPHGRAMSRLAAHPRIAHMLLRARAESEREAAIACDLAALLGDRDPLRAEGPAHDADLRLRLELLHALRRRERLPDRAGGMIVLRDALRRALDESSAWRRTVGVTGAAPADGDTSCTGRLLALAYPDRLGQRRAGASGRYLLRNGTGAFLHDSPALAISPFLVVADSDGRRPEARVWLAAPLEASDLARNFAAQIEREDRIAFDESTRTARATRRERLGAIILRELPLPDPPPGAVATALVRAVRESRLALLEWSDEARRLRERLAFVALHDPAWPTVDDDSLLATLDDWLTPHLQQRQVRSLAALDLGALLLDRLMWPQRAALDTLAPTHFTAPTGNRLRIDYADPAAPVVAVRLQEMFGCAETPRLLAGRVPVTLHLLSPAHRPVQVTRDLAGFWGTSYFDVRREMKGRYPRHHWPDDPMAAAPTHRAKPRGGGR